MAANTHRVLKTADDSYLNALNIKEEKETLLKNVRDQVREALRDGFGDWSSFIQKSKLFEDTVTGRRAAEQNVSLKPKFKMQGSFSYKTLNAPAQTPPQEIDLDDGLFLPVSFLSGNGAIRPEISSQGFFKAVENILEPLCKKNGWTLITDKSSCVRVRISKDSHMDIALYAIPDKDFMTLQEAVLAKATDSYAMDEVVNSLKLKKEIYRKIPIDHIMLAHREDGWKPSDPRKLEDWFHENLETHGEQFRRVSRYLKGWRDHQWAYTSLSSIAIMAAVATVFAEEGMVFENNRDDKALLNVAKKLPTIFNANIKNPVVNKMFLDEGWSTEQRADFVSRAKNLKNGLEASLAATTPEEALKHLQSAFGTRISSNQSLVELEQVAIETKSAMNPAAAVMSLGILKKLGDDPEVRAAVKKEGDSRYG